MPDTILEENHPKSFQQSVVEIGSVVSEEKMELFIGWFFSKNESSGSAHRPRWLPQPNLA
jgi:hypothetical protein